jgi:hypothetical protein
MLKSKYLYHIIYDSPNIQKVYYKDYIIGDLTTADLDIFPGEILLTLTPSQLKYYVKTFKILFPPHLHGRISEFLKYKTDQEIIFNTDGLFTTEEMARSALKRRVVEEIIK